MQAQISYGAPVLLQEQRNPPSVRDFLASHNALNNLSLSEGNEPALVFFDDTYDSQKNVNYRKEREKKTDEGPNELMNYDSIQNIILFMTCKRILADKQLTMLLENRYVREVVSESRIRVGTAQRILLFIFSHRTFVGSKRLFLGISSPSIMLRVINIDKEGIPFVVEYYSEQLCLIYQTHCDSWDRVCVRIEHILLSRSLHSLSTTLKYLTKTYIQPLPNGLPISHPWHETYPPVPLKWS